MSGDAPPVPAVVADCFASEYGWSLEYIDSIPADVSAMLIHGILWRKGVNTVRMNAETEGVSRLSEIIERVKARAPLTQAEMREDEQ